MVLLPAAGARARRRAPLVSEGPMSWAGGNNLFLEITSAEQIASPLFHGHDPRIATINSSAGKTTRTPGAGKDPSMHSSAGRSYVARHSRIPQVVCPSGIDSLPTECAARLLEAASLITLPERKTLIETGDTPEGCYWLEDGLMKGSIATPLGEERIIELLAPGSTIGAISLLDGLPQTATVQAVTRCRLTFVSRCAFVACMQEFPEMRTYVAMTIAAHLRRAGDKAAIDSFFPAKARVARALLQFAEHLGDTTPPPDLLIIRRKFRKGDIAALAHVARENASRILSGWIKAELISFPSPSVCIIKRVKLEREAQILH
jgi:CRP/FNR family transcriptional regulator, cyclic AMP receptor protein